MLAEAMVAIRTRGRKGKGKGDGDLRGEFATVSKRVVPRMQCGRPYSVLHHGKQGGRVLQDGKAQGRVALPCQMERT